MAGRIKMPNEALKTLEGRTQWYWQVSKAFSGKGVDINTGDAIEILSTLRKTAFTIQLAERVKYLLYCVIHACAYSKQPESAEVIDLTERRAQRAKTHNLGHQHTTPTTQEEVPNVAQAG